MTDRIKGFVVTLDRDIREDDAIATINAIGQLRGVVSVKLEVADIGSEMAEARVRSDLIQKLWNVLHG